RRNLCTRPCSRPINALFRAPGARQPTVPLPIERRRKQGWHYGAHSRFPLKHTAFTVTDPAFLHSFTYDATTVRGIKNSNEAQKLRTCGLAAVRGVYGLVLGGATAACSASAACLLRKWDPLRTIAEIEGDPRSPI